MIYLDLLHYENLSYSIKIYHTYLLPIGSMYAILVTFTINIPQMLAYIYIPYMDPMGYCHDLPFTY